MEKRPDHVHPTQAPPPHAGPSHEKKSSVDTAERGLSIGGVPQVMDKRLFMQLLVLRDASAHAAKASIEVLAQKLAAARVPSVIYEDINDPSSLGLLTFGEDPIIFATRVRAVLADVALASLVTRPEMTMIGRTYATGYESDLAFWLLRRPVETVLHEGWDWAIYYPLRRTGAFNRLSKEEQGAILREHGTIGRAYGEQDLAHDIRLACHGIDTNDNDFVIGLIGAALHPLSHVVQSMRGTIQTSQYMEKMGPFFVGRAVHRVKGEG
jgi:hypothetical protein